ncbi:MAG: hypothetical protein PVI30_16015 [Myxococcales bacterium]
MTRYIDHRYRDPLDEVWLHAAQELGLRIERSDSVYASYDGRGTLTLSTVAHFDPDDSLAQLIFHELCHALVAGPHAMRKPDWGLSNTDDRDLTLEHACHRLQAALADQHGLRRLLAVTTDHRPYWDALPEDPLADGDDRAIALARGAFTRARQPPFGPVLQRALQRTARVAEVVAEVAADDSAFHRPDR